MTETYDTTNPDQPTIDKDPDAVLDYSWNWEGWLNGDTISSRTITADSGITVDSSQVVGDVVTAILSGGTVGKTHRVRCRIVTAAGLTEDRSIFLRIVER